MLLGNGAVIAAIADGVGGATGGAEAAEIAVESLLKFSGVPEELSERFSDIVEEIKRRAAHDESLSRMATTLSTVLFKDGSIFVAHVGDTRVYHLRGYGLVNLTEDQTEVAALRRKGVLTEYQARRYPRRNVLLSVLSAKAEYEVYRSEARAKPGDRLVLLTDGVYRKVLRRPMLSLSLAHPRIADFSEALRREVLAASPEDNYSALAIEL